MKYKVMIPTSGIGSRLGDFSQWTNKSLSPVGEKPVICHIIDLYDKDIEIVILLGHFGNHVKNLLELVYPDRKFTFVWVDNFSGDGSSLVYSILQAEQVIDCPFILHACDTMISDYEEIPMPDFNWLGGGGPSSANYTTFDVSDNIVTKIYDKGQNDFDYAFIGIAGIFDYEDFFKEARRLYESDRLNNQLSNIHVHSKQIESGIKFEHRSFNWNDTGNIDSLKETREYFSKPRITSLNKKCEAIYIIDEHVVKFFADTEIAKKRVSRAKMLKKSVPEIVSFNDNFYRYKYVEGELLADIVTPRITEDLLYWAKNFLWEKAYSVEYHGFMETCRKFYYDKTLKRLEDFCTITGIKDEASIINDYEIPSVKSMLKSIPEESLCTAQTYMFHGDFILDNIIYTPDKKFVLMDWRQDFGDSLSGDIYYDLAKLNCSFVFNQKIIKDGLYSISEKLGEVKIYILINSNLLNCREVFKKFVRKQNFNQKKIDIISALIFLNMSPLHDYPLNLFLYYFGRLKLYLARGKL